MPANYSYKNPFHTGRTIMERHQSSESLAINLQKDLKQWSKAKENEKYSYTLVFGAPVRKNRWLCRKQWRWKGKKSVTPSLGKDVSHPHTILRKRLLCISGVPRELISGNPDSPAFPHTGEPSLKISVPAASLRAQRWVQHSTPDTVRR